MDVVWSGTLDRRRQEEARNGVKAKKRCTFSLIGETGHQSSAMEEMQRHIERQRDTQDEGK